MTKIFDSGPKKDINDLEKRVFGVEKQFDGFLQAIKIVAVSITILGAAGITTVYSGAFDRVQTLIEARVEESVNTISGELKSTIEESVRLAGASESLTKSHAITAGAALIELEKAKATFSAGIATLDAVTSPIYATATAQAILIEESEFFAVRAYTHYNIDNTKEQAEIIKEHTGYEYTIYRLIDNYFTATFGRFPTKDDAQDVLNDISNVASGPFLLDIAKDCPIRKEYDDFIDCNSKINEGTPTPN